MPGLTGNLSPSSCPAPTGHLFYHPHLHRQAGALCGARGLRSALARSTPSFPLPGSSAERTASQRAPSTHMPWTAIPIGHHTDLPPAVIPTDSIIPSFNPVIPAFPIVMPGPDRASPTRSPLLYVQKIVPGARSNCTYRCHFALPGHFHELYVQKIAISLHFNCTYRLVRDGV